MPPSSRGTLRRLGRLLFAWGVVPLLTLLGAALLLEGVLRFQPVNEGCRTPPVNEARPMMTCEPDRAFTWSRFPDFSMTNRVRANNLGYINDQDYTTGSNLPLVVVIGDSLVEALMVPYGETVHGRMAHALEGRARVYSFGASGAQLAQYLAYANEARQRFQPRALVLIVAPNDFEASFREYVSAPGFHYFVETGDGDYRLQRFDFDPGFVRAAVRHSRLLLYLAINVEIGTELGRLRARGRSVQATPDPAVLHRQQGARFADARVAASLFLDRVADAAGLPPERILIVADASRPIPLDRAQAAAASPEQAHDGAIRRHFIARARARGFGVLDAQEVFLSRNAGPPEALEFPHDTHWNARAHALVADAVLEAPTLRSLRRH